MTHGGAGDFDIDLTAGNGVECRTGGVGTGDYKLIFTFSNNLTSVDSASVSCGSVSSSTMGPNADQYTVNLTGQNSCNAQYNTVTLNDVNDSAGNHSDTVSGPQWGLLIGDNTANGVVSNTEVSMVKAQVGATVDSSNFRNDVNANGIISNTDVSTTKAQVGTTLP